MGETEPSSASAATFSPSSVLMNLLSPTVHSEKVNLYFEKLPDDVREKITKEDLAQYLDSDSPQVTEKIFLKAIERGKVDPDILKDTVRDRAKLKLSNLYKLNGVTPRDIDVLIAQSLFAETYTSPRPLDPCSYAAHGVIQSYDTLTSDALFSTRSISQLQGDSVHFMMFAKGQTQIQCNRFSFGENPIFSQSPRIHEGDPCRVDETLCNLLQTTKDGLTNHALRLEMIQNILRNANFAELEVQALFSHWLGELVRHLDGEDNDLRVTDVIGMTPLRVMVEVCNEYLTQQGRPVNSMGSGFPSQLSIQSDVAVCKESLQSNASDAFLYSSYHVEMTQALKLKNSAMDCKSQLLAESLARSISLLNKDKELPEVLYSMLCDGLCLHVLVHFPKKNVAYLSHREIEPGRMTCVVAWLHKLSARSGLTEEEFLNMGFVIGQSLEAEVMCAVNQKRERTQSGQVGKTTMGQVKKHIKTNRTSENKRMCIDVVADEERVRREEEQSQFAAFTRMQNYYRYSDSVPLTEAILNKNVHHGEHKQLSLEENLLRASLIQGDATKQEMTSH